MPRLEFAVLLNVEQGAAHIVALVTRFLEVLASLAAAVDVMQTPKLDAKFLQGQLWYASLAVPQQLQQQPATRTPSGSDVCVHNPAP
jgi:hypothetical protein